MTNKTNITEVRDIAWNLLMSGIQVGLMFSGLCYTILKEHDQRLSILFSLLLIVFTLRANNEYSKLLKHINNAKSGTGR